VWGGGESFSCFSEPPSALGLIFFLSFSLFPSKSSSSPSLAS
jgi:hypothetical protein